MVQNTGTVPSGGITSLMLPQPTLTKDDSSLYDFLGTQVCGRQNAGDKDRAWWWYYAVELSMKSL